MVTRNKNYLQANSELIARSSLRHKQMTTYPTKIFRKIKRSRLVTKLSAICKSKTNDLKCKVRLQVNL